ncbi:heme-binding protein [Dietzia maris]|uniref:heme-binding protein n=1 Tax=Dietzia maris TaxID=37915 RepID=UPI00223BA960|nr:heme-binding protein [Dietzia maris]
MRQASERMAAVARYSGRWSETSYRRHLAALEGVITWGGLVASGPPRFPRFNPPLTPWFLRRNEVVQDVEWPPG